MKIKTMIPISIFTGIVCVFAATQMSYSAEDEFGPRSRELTQDDINKGYDDAFKMDMKHHTTPADPDRQKVLDVDKDRPLGSEGNTKTDDQMSDQNSYTE